ncbi:helix-turn-helix domain-containing protein [Paludibacter jiangxiensis]|uniref:Helix-turn-helix domain-containing protein n=1 Tax=Paludibacter jiangxiensis TaxID=681398 RepID=A0A170ZSA9_9BACT|nr:AraC family transcriptional regulator [Paludibacter jiangxiensis]GAT62963.1 helix-turn-helix domain-containing protein [Paludibacter jiangxiensis]
MDNSITLYVNTTLIISCLVFAIVFFAFPLPPDSKGLKSYKVSLRTLGIAYSLFASLVLISEAIEEPEVDLLSVINLNIASLQSILFAMALVILLNPAKITRKYLLKHVSPIIAFDLIYTLVALRWGNPEIGNLDALVKLSLTPPVVIRECFWLFFVIQLGYLTVIFIRAVKNYDKALDNYFSDGYKIHIRWVSICYYSALSLGVFGVFMMCFFSFVWEIVFTVCCIIYYVGFGVCYIQYPRTFIKIEPVLRPVIKPSEIHLKINNRFSWAELKGKVLKEKYYTRMGVNIEDMAQYLKVGRTTLSGLINKEEGVNFNSWIRRLRIAEAIRLLQENSEHSLSQISEMVGYSEPSNFSRQFKAETGVSPSEWCLQKRFPA